MYYTPRPDGEEIPNGTSEIKVVDADYQFTPGVVYPNSQPTDIGGYKPAPEDPEETTEVEETTGENGEEPTEPASQGEETTETTTQEASNAHSGGTTATESTTASDT